MFLSQYNVIRINGFVGVRLALDILKNKVLQHRFAFFWPETGMYIPYTVYHKSPIHLLQGTKEIRNVLQGIGCLTIC
jgi:hypothetical protein